MGSMRSVAKVLAEAGLADQAKDAALGLRPWDRWKARARWPRRWPRPDWPTRRRTRCSGSRILGIDRKCCAGGRGPGQGRPGRPGEGRGDPGEGRGAPDRGSLASIGSADSGGRGPGQGRPGRPGEGRGAPGEGRGAPDREPRTIGSAALGGRGPGQGRPGRPGEGRGAPDRGSFGTIGSAARGGRGPGQGRPGRPGEGRTLQAKDAVLRIKDPWWIDRKC